VEVGIWQCDDKRFHLKARSSCYAMLCYSSSPRRKKKNWGHLQLMMSINQVHCIALFVYLLRRGTRGYVFTSVFVALVLLFGYVYERSKGGWENEFDGGLGYLFTIL